MEEIKKCIYDSEIFLVTKENCKFCNMAKDYISNHPNLKNSKVTLLNLSTNENGPNLFVLIKEMTNQNTVPNIWIKGNHIGTYTNLVEKYPDDF